MLAHALGAPSRAPTAGDARPAPLDPRPSARVARPEPRPFPPSRSPESLLGGRRDGTGADSLGQAS